MTMQQVLGFITVFLVGTSAAFQSLFHTERLHQISSKNGFKSSTALCMGVTIYGHPDSRSPLVDWACYELGVDFDMGDLSKNPHPFQQIPCLTDDDNVVVFESGAILQYLLNYYVSLSDSDRAATMSWITWTNASLDPICFVKTPEGTVYDIGLGKPNRRIERLNEILSQQDYLVASEFSLADVAVASYLLHMLRFFPDFDVSRWPSIVRYLKDCASRPAYGQAFGDQVQSMLVNKLSEWQ